MKAHERTYVAKLIVFPNSPIRRGPVCVFCRKVALADALSCSAFSPSCLIQHRRRGDDHRPLYSENVPFCLASTVALSSSLPTVLVPVYPPTSLSRHLSVYLSTRLPVCFSEGKVSLVPAHCPGLFLCFVFFSGGCALLFVCTPRPTAPHGTGYRQPNTRTATNHRSPPRLRLHPRRRQQGGCCCASPEAAELPTPGRNNRPAGCRPPAHRSRRRSRG